MLAIKLFLTILVAAVAVSPLLIESWSGGILRELSLFGPVYGSIIAIAFLILVAVYCVDLQRLLEAVPLQSRTATPKSVWWMFLIPYNFVEDFFIVHNTTQSIQNAVDQGVGTTLRKPFGALSGFGWCILQIITLIPHPAGSIAAPIAIVLWIVHWSFVRRATRMLVMDTR